ncbi:MAG: hypothetical protein R3C42_01555 [Parvularculaceae bacterium]|nr:hypothetical protein [Parvularculaceae bacterium]
MQGRKIGRWPFFGAALKSRLEKIADRLRDPGAPIPNAIVAHYALHRSRKRFRRFKALLELRRRGVVIVTDRYPQAEVAGVHDGPILAGVAKSAGVARTQYEERRLYEIMASHVPTLIIRLHVELETAMARKPDHVRSLIARKIDTLPQINFNGARMIDLDATDDYVSELELAKAAVDKALDSVYPASRR